jgi:hypothetical protein
MEYLPMSGHMTGDAVACAIVEKLDTGAMFFHADDVRALLARYVEADQRATEAERIAKRIMDPDLHHLRMEDGAIDLALTGPLVQHMGLVITEHFRATSGENYLEMTYTTKSEPIEHFNWTIRKQVGANSPHQLRAKAEAERDELRARFGATARAWLAIPQDGTDASVVTDAGEAAEMARHPDLWRVVALIEGGPLPAGGE